MKCKIVHKTHKIYNIIHKIYKNLCSNIFWVVLKEALAPCKCAINLTKDLACDRYSRLNMLFNCTKFLKNWPGLCTQNTYIHKISLKLYIPKHCHWRLRSLEWVGTTHLSITWYLLSTPICQMGLSSEATENTNIDFNR